MSDPVLWIGVVLLAGALGALAARAAKLPSACGALAAGLVVAWLSGGAAASASAAATAALIAPGLTALLAFSLGAEIDLGRLAREGRALFGACAIQTAAAALCVLLVSRGLLGLTWEASLLLGAAAAAPSPAATIAVVSEARARGAFAQRLLVLAACGLVLACAAGGMASSPARAAAGLAVNLAVGVACGAVMLVPLSRMAARGAILTCLGAGAALAAGAASLLGWPAGNVALIAIPAGAVAMALIPNRDLIREALRDLAVPCAVALFAIGGATAWSGMAPAPAPRSEPVAALDPAAGPPAPAPGWWAAPVLIVAARTAGLLLAGAAAGAPRAALALVPLAEGSLSLPPLIGSQGLDAAIAPEILGPLRAAGLLSLLPGLAAAGWAIRTSGAPALDPDDPDAWRAPIR